LGQIEWLAAADLAGGVLPAGLLADGGNDVER